MTTIYYERSHPLPMRPGWTHWYAKGNFDNTSYFLDDLGLRFKITVTERMGCSVDLLERDRGGTGRGFANSAIQLKRRINRETFDEAMLAAEALRDWLALRTAAERNALFLDWSRQAVA